MAETLNIGGQEFKKRSPLGVWGLSIVTIFVYYLVWYYKVNDEARRYLGDDSINPGVATLAVSLGALLIVPPFVSVYRTGERIQRMQERAGVQNAISPALGLLGAFFLYVHVPYIQENLNKIWRRYQQPAGLQAQGVPPPGTEPPASQFTG